MPDYEDAPEPDYCAKCGEPLPDRDYARVDEGSEPGVMAVYNVTCKQGEDCGEYGITLPWGDIDQAAQRLERAGRRGGRR